MSEYPVGEQRAAERRDGDGVELVHEKVRRLILSGELRAGESFSVVRLAAQCGVSRTPLRRGPGRHVPGNRRGRGRSLVRRGRELRRLVRRSLVIAASAYPAG